MLSLKSSFPRVPRVVLIFVSLLAGAGIAALVRAYVIAASLASAAAVISGLVFVGHLVTIDDDAPHGWSNPDGDRELWHDSLRDLLLKFIVLLLSGAVAVLLWSVARH